AWVRTLRSTGRKVRNPPVVLGGSPGDSFSYRFLVHTRYESILGFLKCLSGRSFVRVVPERTCSTVRYSNQLSYAPNGSAFVFITTSPAPRKGFFTCPRAGAPVLS